MFQIAIERWLDRTLIGMKITFACFTLGLGWLLFGPGWDTVSAFMLAGPAGIFYGWSIYRNREIRKLGFNDKRPYPVMWREAFIDRETLLFRRFTTLWTVFVFLWGVLRFV